MPRDIVILCDGTSNEIEANRTNILRLYGCLRQTGRQVVWYDPGVGTFGSENAWFRARRTAAELLGLLTGWGLDQNVKEAYRFLVETWEEGDRIWLVGFSRGAYTVRVLAGFLHAVGLMKPVQLNLVDYAYRAYKRAETGDIDTDRSLREVRLFRRILQPRHPRIEALALFETVASVIEWGRYLPRLRSHAFTRENPSVAAVRHALAMHERRIMFRPLRWRESAGQDVAEVWFRGAHGDVGGGYPEARSGLAKVALDWMIGELRRFGLDIDEEVVGRLVHGRGSDHAPPDPAAPVTNTMSLAWALLELLPARRQSDETGLSAWHIPLGRPRRITAGSRIHRSVLEVEPLPENMPPEPVIVDTETDRSPGAIPLPQSGHIADRS